MFNNNKTLKGVGIAVFTILLKLTHAIKVSFLVGSKCAFFSLGNCLGPLSGAFAGVSGAISVSLLSALMRSILIGLNPFILAVYHVPSFFASLYLATPHWSVRRMLPLLCMALFVLHPVGSGAWWYSLYWLIPVACSFINNSFFISALGSTFMAHAIGSVIWIYLVPMNVAMYSVLAPIVIIERLLFASGMTLAYYGISFAFKKAFGSQKTSVATSLL